MIKKVLCGLLILLVPLCGGCWNYRSLDELSLIAGIAIDRNAQSSDYHITYQTVDLTGDLQSEGGTGKLIESEGKTLFDAARNAARRIIGQLYFGHTQTVIISDDIARNEDILNLISWLMRDAEIRETLILFVSAEETAADIFRYETIVSPVTALEISRNIETDNKLTSSSVYRQLYQVYNILHTEGIELALPVLTNVVNNGELTAELFGSAVFKEHKLVGYLTPVESKYFLIAINEVEGGILTFPSEGSGPDNVSLEIKKNTTKTSFTNKDGKLKIRVEIEMDTSFAERMHDLHKAGAQQYVSLENTAAQILANRVSETIKKVQTEYGSDIFGFGSLICKNNNVLWKQLRDNWDTLFPSLDVEVLAKVNIVNSASMKIE